MSWYDRLFVVLFAQGIPKEEIQSLTLDEASLMWRGWLNGAYGTLGNSLKQYQLYIQLHSMRENFISANKKNYKPKKPIKFEEFDQPIAEFLDISADRAKNQGLQQQIFNMFEVKHAGNNTDEGI